MHLKSAVLAFLPHFLVKSPRAIKSSLLIMIFQCDDALLRNIKWSAKENNFPTCLPPIMCGFRIKLFKGVVWKENMNRHHGVCDVLFLSWVPSEQFSKRWKRVLKCPMMRQGQLY